MDDILLIDAAERYLRGEMNEQERSYFEELRKTNPELDQLVVEHTIFLQELHKYGDTRNFKQAAHEVETRLAEEGFLKNNEQLKGKARLVYLWNRHKRTALVAASIAGLISLVTTGLVEAYKGKTNADITAVVKKIDDQGNEIRTLRNEVKNSKTMGSAAPKVRMDADFRGTGFLIDAAGYIVTNEHVASEAKHQLFVENSRGEQFTAERVYYNEVTDIAILKITDNSFPVNTLIPYSFRRTDAPLGERVFTMGFSKPEIVYTEGYVSARNGFKMDSVYYQLSADIAEGNSGSPVISPSGELMGIITLKENNIPNVAFAVKSKNILRAVDELKKQKEHSSIKLPSGNNLRKYDRASQIRKVEDCVFMVKGN